MKGSMAGPQQEEKDMKLTSIFELQAKTPREIAGMKREIEKELGACEKQKRRCQAALATLRAAPPRRTMRPGF